MDPLVPRGRLELPRLSTLVPKTSVSAISPPGHCLVPTPGIEPGSTITYLVGGLGIEPNSTALQAVAEITRLAHPLKTFRIVLFR